MSKLQEFRAQHPEYDDVSDQELAKAIHRKAYANVPYAEFESRLMAPSKASQPAAQPAPQQQQDYPTLQSMFGQGSPLQRFVGGAVVKPVLGASQVLNKGLAAVAPGLFGGLAQGSDELIKSYDAYQQQGMKELGNEGYDVVGLAGQIASPINAAAKLKAASTVAGKVAQGAGVGLISAGIDPVNVDKLEPGMDYGSEKRTNMAMATILGGVLPAGIEAIKGGAKLISDVAAVGTKAGKEKILREWFDNLLPKDKAKVVSLLQKPDDVAGSAQTASQRLADMPESTSLASAEEALSRKAAGGVSQDFAARSVAQEKARIKLLDEALGGNPQSIKALEQVRETTASNNYATAFSTPIKADSNLTSIVDNPYVREVLPDVQKSLLARKKSPKTDLTEAVHLTKLALDAKLKNANSPGQTAISSAQQKDIQDVRAKLIGWLEDKNPAYKKARLDYARDSAPINQAEVGAYLTDKLRSASEQERANVFLQAMRDAPTTLRKSSSGRNVATKLEDALTPQQLAAIKAIENDVLKQQKALANAKRTGKIDEAVGEGGGIPNMLSTTATIINAALRKVKADARVELEEQAKDLLLNPDKLAQFIGGIPKDKGGKVFLQTWFNKLSPEMQDKFRAVGAGMGYGVKNAKANVWGAATGTDYQKEEE
jgi:hypothetical protein